MALRKIVDHRNVVTLLQKQVDRMRADVSRSTGDQNARLSHPVIVTAQRAGARVFHVSRKPGCSVNRDPRTSRKPTPGKGRDDIPSGIAWASGSPDTET